MIKLKSKTTKYKNFTTLKTSNAVTSQWNNIRYKKGKNEVSIGELQYILGITTNKEVYEEVLEIYNKKAKRSNRVDKTSYQIYDIYAFSKKNIKKAIEINKANVRKEKAEQLLKDIGYKSNMNGQLYHKLGEEYVLNPNMIGKSFEEIEEEARKVGAFGGLSEVEIDVDVAKKKVEYDIFNKEARKLRKDKADAINEATNKRLESFLFGGVKGGMARGRRIQGYFGNLLGNDIEKEKLRQLYQRLNVGEKLAIEQLMTDNRFIKQWSSDQEDATFDSSFRKKRLDEIIKIIENYLGEGIEVDKATGETTYYKLSSNRTVDTSLTLDQFIGR